MRFARTSTAIGVTAIGVTAIAMLVPARGTAAPTATEDPVLHDVTYTVYTDGIVAYADEDKSASGARARIKARVA